MASRTARFLTNTYQLVDDESTDRIVSWNQTGDAFVVWNTAEFSRDVLPCYFKHNNFSSFVRQLNTYGFRKIVQDRWEFRNENFKKDRKELLFEIRRRKNENPSPALTIDAGKSGSPAAAQITPVNSGGDLISGSTSNTSAPKNTVIIDLATAQKFEAIAEDYERLRKLYEQVCSELTESRIKCDELTGILLQQMEVGPETKNQSCGSNAGAVGIGEKGKSINVVNDGDENDDGDSNCVKIFGVLVKKKTNKRVGDEIFDTCGGSYGNKERKMGGGAAAAEWMKVGTS